MICAVDFVGISVSSAFQKRSIYDILPALYEMIKVNVDYHETTYFDA